MGGVGVKVGTKVASGSGVGVTRWRCTRSAAEQPNVRIRKTATMSQVRWVVWRSGERARSVRPARERLDGSAAS